MALDTKPQTVRARRKETLILLLPGQLDALSRSGAVPKTDLARTRRKRRDRHDCIKPFADGQRVVTFRDLIFALAYEIIQK